MDKSHTLSTEGKCENGKAVNKPLKQTSQLQGAWGTIELWDSNKQESNKWNQSSARLIELWIRNRSLLSALYLSICIQCNQTLFSIQSRYFFFLKRCLLLLFKRDLWKFTIIFQMMLVSMIMSENGHHCRIKRGDRDGGAGETGVENCQFLWIPQKSLMEK